VSCEMSCMSRIVSARVWLHSGSSESLWYVRMKYRFTDRGTSPQSVSETVERVLEVRVLGEVAGVIRVM